MVNIVVFEKLFQKYRKDILQARLLMVEGKMQREGKVIHVVAKRCVNVSSLLGELSVAANEHIAIQAKLRSDENDTDMANYTTNDSRVQKVVQAELFYSGRNFR